MLLEHIGFFKKNYILKICPLSFNKYLGILSSLFICGNFIIVDGIEKKSENIFKFVKRILNQSNAILTLSHTFKNITLRNLTSVGQTI